MKKTLDIWFVRLPDGRVLRAPTTQTLRQHLGAGHIPHASWVRRSADEEWMALDWTQEFADLIQTLKTPRPVAVRRESLAGQLPSTEPANLATRLDPLRLKTVGLRGLLEELVAALDSTLARPKLVVAGLAGVLGGAVVAFAVNARGLIPPPQAQWLWAGIALALGVIGCVANALLTQITYLELCRVRPADWREARTGLARNSRRLLGAFLVAAGLTALAVWLVRQVPPRGLAEWLAARDLEGAGSVILPAVTVAAMLLEMILWPVLGFTLLLGPVAVVEERSALGTLGQWWGTVRGNWGRLILYQFAAGLVGVATLVFALPVALVVWGRWENLDPAVAFGLTVLAGLAAAPLIAYLAVAHVFLYLNLRYEVGRKDRVA